MRKRGPRRAAEDLGSASDTAEVLVEIRAAELSNLAASNGTPSECQGWIDYAKDRDCINAPRDEWEAGWLGRIIHEHGRAIMAKAVRSSP